MENLTEYPNPVKVGFWYSREEPHLPIPQVNDMPFDGQDEFLKKLEIIEKSLKDSYYAHVQAQRKALEEWRNTDGYRQGKSGLITQTHPNVIAWCGWQNCRCCHCLNGTLEFVYMGWRWPEGYSHYIRTHNVRPDDFFQQFIAIVDLSKV